VLRVFYWNSNQITIVERGLKYHELVKFGFGEQLQALAGIRERDVYDYHYIWGARRTYADNDRHRARQQFIKGVSISESVSPYFEREESRMTVNPEVIP
jgi:hypothetical protein